MLEGLLAQSFFEQYGLLIILAVFLLLMFAYNFWRSKKYAQQEQSMIENVKVGTKVKTYSGFYGTVMGIRDTADGKIVKLSLDGKATVEIDFRAIYSVEAAETTKVVEEPKLEVKEEVSEEKTEEINEDIIKEAAKKQASKTKKSK